jgi:hypothetical protein
MMKLIKKKLIKNNTKIKDSSKLRLTCQTRDIDHTPHRIQ